MARIRRIAADRESGASGVLEQAVGVLGDARRSGVPVRPVAEALLAAQPSMAPLWTAAAAALDERQPSAFERYVQRMKRASQALCRHAITLFNQDARTTPLEFVTLSFSGTVLDVLLALNSTTPVRLACAEGRPGFEGRRLAERAAAAGIAVTFYTDASLCQALATAEGVLVGADALTPEWFLNKSGTRMLAAAAAHVGVPVYVAAAQHKFVSSAVAARLHIREESASEVWATPPPGVTVRNPYFERTPLDLVTAVISDVGVLGTGMIADSCPTADDPILLGLTVPR